MTRLLRPLRSERDYNAALAEIEKFFAREPKKGTPAADRFDLLALLIEDYERRHWAIEAPDPVSAIQFRMDTGGFTQADLGRVLGSRQRASDILAGRRTLTLSMIRALHREWGIPAESLIQPLKVA